MPDLCCVRFGVVFSLCASRDQVVLVGAGGAAVALGVTATLESIHRFAGVARVNRSAPIPRLLLAVWPKGAFCMEAATEGVLTVGIKDALFEAGLGWAESVATATAAQKAEAGGTGEGASRLESRGSKWNQVTEAVIVGHRCDARTCPVCGKRRGHETRQALLARAPLFSTPLLLTFTIDPKRFESAQQAHEVVSAGGFIRRLMKFLGIRYWVWVMEFQRNGWPHWHVLVDVSERGPLGPGDLRRVWRLWRDEWGLGGLDVQKRREAFASPEHAVMYVTKYLMKPPKHGFPEWFLRGKRRRLVGASKFVGALTRSRGDGLVQPEVDGEESRDRQDARPLIERMSECGQFCRVVVHEVDLETGQERCRVAGLLPVSRDDLLRLQAVGGLPEGVQVDLVDVEFMGGRTRSVRIQGDRVVDQVARLVAWGKRSELVSDLGERVQDLRDRLLAGALVAKPGTGDRVLWEDVG